MKCPLTKKDCYKEDCAFWVIEEYEDGEKEEYCAVRNMLTLTGYALALWIENLELLNNAIKQSMEEGEEIEEESGELVTVNDEKIDEHITIDDEEIDEHITVSEEDLKKFNIGGENEG